MSDIVNGAAPQQKCSSNRHWFVAMLVIGIIGTLGFYVYDFDGSGSKAMMVMGIVWIVVAMTGLSAHAIQPTGAHLFLTTGAISIACIVAALVCIGLGGVMSAGALLAVAMGLTYAALRLAIRFKNGELIIAEQVVL